MIIDSKVAYVKKRATFETLIPTIPIGLNPIVFIEDTREMWTCGTYFSIGYPNIEVSESGGSVKVEIGNSYFTMSTTGESLSVRKGDGNKIILSSNALTKVDTEAPLEWDITNKKLLHSTSKVTPGSYGQSSNLGNASTFTIPNIVVDKYGHITSAGNSNIEIRDYVEQIAPTSLIGERNILLSYNEANNNSDSAQVRKARGMTYNDSTQRLRIEKGIDTFGTINVTHGDMVVVDGYIIGKLKGDVEGEATPKIHLSEKPEYGGSSTKLYGHVLLKDILGVTKPNPSSNNTNVSSRDIEAYAASPLMVWNTLEDAKKYADSLLGANNAMLFQEAIVAGTTTPGTFTPAAEIGHTYIVDFDNSVYTNNVGYINGEPVEIGDMLICKTKTPASDSSNWREIHDNWTYVQTNTTGTVVGPSSSAPGQIALFGSSSGRVIKGLPTGSMSQILSVGSDGMPTWVNAPDRLNNALSFKVNSNSVLSYDGSVARYINLIQGSNVSITHDSQGNIIINSDAGEDTKNTAGATNNINNKLFLVGALTQDSSPQTYTNQYIYIGADNKLYVNNAEVSVQGHIHPYLPVDKPAVGIQGGIQGSLPYQSATNITSMLTPPTTNGWVLKYNTATKAPYWAEDLNTVYGTKEFTVNSIKYNVYTESETLPTLWAPSTLGTRGQIAKVNDSETGFIWADDLNTTYSTQNMNINGTDYAIYTTASGLPSIKAPNVLGTANTVLATNSTESGFVWVAANNHNHDWNQILNKPTTFKPILNIVSDWDNIFNDSNWGFFSGANNSPINGTSVMGINIPLVSTPNYAMQLAGRNDILYFRTKEANTNQAWRTILHSGNSSVSKSAETLTVKLNGVSQSLTNTDTWIANALNTAGYVAAPTAAQSNMVWKTDSLGNPAWRLDAAGTDTLNTTGATNLIAKKLFLTGAETQTANPQTYTNENVYIGIDNCLYSNGKKVLTDHQSLANYVTLDTAQEISGIKTFTSGRINIGNLSLKGDSSGNAYIEDLTGIRKSIYAASFVKLNGTSNQFLKADGSVDSNEYVTTNTEQLISGRKIYSTDQYYRNNVGIVTLDGQGLLFSDGERTVVGDTTRLHRIRSNDSNLEHWRAGVGRYDILDGYNWKSIVDGRYLPLTGGTMTGFIRMPDNVAIQASEGFGMLFYDGSVTQVGSAARTTNIRGNLTVMNNGVWDTSNFNPNTKLNVSGGTMTGDLLLSQPSNVGFANGQRIRDDGGAGLLISGGNKINLITNGDNVYINNSKIWHTGNDGSGSGLDADTLDGLHAYHFFRRLGNTNSGTSGAAGWREKLPITTGTYYGHETNIGDIALLNLENAYGQILIDTYGLWFRHKNYATSTIESSSFIKLANLTDNVASATKLQTARSIWGQLFDGTSDISGIMSGVRSINNTTVIDYFSGQGQYFYTSGFNATPTMSLVDANVGIGTANPGYKLDVYGNFRATTTGTFGGHVTAGGFSTDGVIYSTGDAGTDSQYGYISVMRAASVNNATAFAWVRAGITAFGIGHNTSNQIVLGQGVNNKTLLPWLVFDRSMLYAQGITASGNIVGANIIKTGGNSDQILRADGSVINFQWSSTSGTPAYVWGTGNTSNDTKVYSPSTFRVANANTVGDVGVGNLAYGYNQRNHASESDYYTGDSYVLNYMPVTRAAFFERGGWSFANNGYVQTEFGNIHLAGTAVSTFGGLPNITSLYITPLNGSVPNSLLGEMLFYSANGTGYSSGWTRVLTNRNWDRIVGERYLPLAGGTMTGALNMNSVINMNGRDIVTSPGTIIRGTSSYTELITQYGSVQIGPMNDGHAHIYTDRPNFYFNKALKILGNDVWHAGNFNPGSYLPLSGGTITGKVYVKSFTEGSYGGAIEIRERDHVSTSQSGWDWAPRLSFHWGGRHVRTFGLRSDGLFAVNDVPISLSDHTHNYVPSRARDTWNDNTVINNVVGQLTWNNYGNAHTIFDASKSLTPSNSACNNANSAIEWSPQYPTLMGWNGSATYGVRVDSARKADIATSATTASVANRIANDSANMAFHWNGQSGQPTWLWGGNIPGEMYVYNPSNFSVNYATTAGNVSAVQVIDNRGADRAPSYYTGQRLSAFFNEAIPGTVQGSWHAGITVKGWQEGYAAWQLFGYSSTGAPATELFFRTGITDSWGTTAKLYHSLNSNNLSTNWSAASLYLNGDIRMNNGSFSAFSYRGGNLYISDGGRPVVVSTPTFSIGDANHDYMSVSDSAMIIDSDLTTGKFKQSGSQSTSYPRLPVVLLSGIADLTSGSYGVNFLYNPLNLTYSLSYDYSKMMLTITIPDQKGVVLYFPDEASLNCQICLTAQGLGTEASNPRFATHRGVGKNAFAIMGADDSTSNACRIRITIMYWGPHGW